MPRREARASNKRPHPSASSRRVHGTVGAAAVRTACVGRKAAGMSNRNPSSSHCARVRGQVAFAIFLTLVIASTSGANPAPSSAASIPLRLPAGITYDKAVGPDSAVVFRHTSHVHYESDRCTGCHPKLFRLLTPTRRTSHRDMDAGRSCGTCHDGTHAFDVRASGSCASCHVGSASKAILDAESALMRDASAFRGPDPYTFPPSRLSPGAVTFRHPSHAGRTMPCSVCHSGLFEMKARPPLENEWMHGRARCGSCHDGRRSFGVDDQKACGRCHAEGKATR